MSYYNPQLPNSLDDLYPQPRYVPEYNSHYDPVISQERPVIPTPRPFIPKKQQTVKQKQKHSLNTIPQDILLGVTRYLNGHEIAQVAKASKHIKETFLQGQASQEHFRLEVDRYGMVAAPVSHSFMAQYERCANALLRLFQQYIARRIQLIYGSQIYVTGLRDTTYRIPWVEHEKTPIEPRPFAGESGGCTYIVVDRTHTVAFGWNQQPTNQLFKTNIHQLASPLTGQSASKTWIETMFCPSSIAIDVYQDIVVVLERCRYIHLFRLSTRECFQVNEIVDRDETVVGSLRIYGDTIGIQFGFSPPRDMRYPPAPDRRERLTFFNWKTRTFADLPSRRRGWVAHEDYHIMGRRGILVIEYAWRDRSPYLRLRIVPHPFAAPATLADPNKYREIQMQRPMEYCDQVPSEIRFVPDIGGNNFFAPVAAWVDDPSSTKRLVAIKSTFSDRKIFIMVADMAQMLYPTGEFSPFETIIEADGETHRLCGRRIVWFEREGYGSISGRFCSQTFSNAAVYDQMPDRYESSKKVAHETDPNWKSKMTSEPGPHSNSRGSIRSCTSVQKGIIHFYPTEDSLVTIVDGGSLGLKKEYPLAIRQLSFFG
ncbi:hypothetical protein BDQ12DRAFT_720461 [Crucibulum laeve]|uniref:F-box domain-containing protein n=1 Tax=Crucibulum laeve TaxID=68775 RepID=A0A5C3M8G2_9AGAR|nr:hypothetical protein BDQ12DRAFT_720461 [Crucibulum laeve]